MIYSIPYIILLFFLLISATITIQRKDNVLLCHRLNIIGITAFFLFFAFRGYIWHDWMGYYPAFEKMEWEDLFYYDYFKNREETPKDENGNYNFECLEAIDTELFNHDMNALLRGERVEMPCFNFVTGKREYRGKVRQLGENDILVIEGIHCLNDALSYSLPKENKFKIYISALTSLNIDEHNRIPTTDGRLIRRIVRDARTRGTSAKQTIAMWPSVRRGEENYIFPYQEDADIMFNSALIYELAVLKMYAEPLLFGIGKDEPEYQEAKRLLKFLDYFVGIPNDSVPVNSLLREFIGGGCFNV